MVALPENSGYSFEGFAQLDINGLAHDIDLEYESIDAEEISDEFKQSYYEDYFSGKVSSLSNFSYFDKFY